MLCSDAHHAICLLNDAKSMLSLRIARRKGGEFSESEQPFRKDLETVFPYLRQVVNLIAAIGGVVDMRIATKHSLSSSSGVGGLVKS
jgi:hypothetical protein